METSVTSPCNNDCLIDPKTELCRGCFRTLNEIINWFRLSNEDKLEILKKVETRRKSLVN